MKYDFNKWRKDTVCPCCGSENFTGGTCEFEQENIFRDWECCDCSAKWSESYKLTSISTDEGFDSLDLDDEVFCANCGREVVPDEAENCPDCGTWLGDEVEEKERGVK